MNFWQCISTWIRSHSGQRERTAKAMFFITESQGMSA